MPHLPRLLTALVLLTPSTSALNLGLSTSLQSPNPSAAISLSEVPLGQGQGHFTLSTRALTLGYRQSLSLPPLGNVTRETELVRPHSGGLRLSSSASGTVGPIALTLNGQAFNAPLASAAPLDLWTEAPQDIRDKGWNLTFDGRYRLQRNLIAHLHTEGSAQGNLRAEVEQRRSLSSEDDLEQRTLSLRAGAQVGAGTLGATAGFTYATDSGLNVRLDTLFGKGFGLVSRVDLPPVAETNLGFYAAYEPWRDFSPSLRYGVEASRALGRGTLGVNLRGGQLPDGQRGGGAELRYEFPLGAPESTPEQE